MAQLPSANALLIGADAYVVDAGYGVTQRLVQARIPLASIRAIFITHHHSDHNLETGNLLYNAWVASLTRPIDAYGPEGMEALVEASLAANKFDIETRMADEGRPDLRKLVRSHAYREGTVMQDERVRVSALRNHHPPIAESYALKFEVKDGPTVVFSGDTAYFEPLAAFARDCDYLVHEAMYGPELDRLAKLNPAASTLMSHLRASHTLTEDVGRIAAAARAKNLVLTHFVPAGDIAIPDEDWLRGVRKGYGGNVIVGRDLLEIALP